MEVFSKVVHIRPKLGVLNAELCGQMLGKDAEADRVTQYVQ
jgi:hypothetical protein